MIPAERQQCIRELLDARGMVSIADMAEHLGVSRMTVRRDMQELEQQGLATLVSGGARRVGRIGFELPLEEKRDLRAAEKAAIAARAADLVRPGMAVFFDAGTTCLACAEAIAARPELRDSILAVTNDFTIVGHLMTHAGCRLYHTGGEVLRDNKSCIGETSASVIARLNLDLSFLSSSSWNAEWISTPNESKIAVKHAILKATRATILVSDSSKYGRLGFFNVVRPQDMQGIITDTGLPPQAQEALIRSGINLMLAEPSTAAPDSPIQAQ